MMLVIREIEWENDFISSVREIDRSRKDGKRNLSQLNWFLDLAEQALKEGRKVKFEFRLEEKIKIPIPI